MSIIAKAKSSNQNLSGPPATNKVYTDEEKKKFLREELKKTVEYLKTQGEEGKEHCFSKCIAQLLAAYKEKYGTNPDPTAVKWIWDKKGDFMRAMGLEGFSSTRDSYSSSSKVGSSGIKVKERKESSSSSSDGWSSEDPTPETKFKSPANLSYVQESIRHFIRVAGCMHGLTTTEAIQNKYAEMGLDLNKNIPERDRNETVGDYIRKKVEEGWFGSDIGEQYWRATNSCFSKEFGTDINKVATTIKQIGG